MTSYYPHKVALSDGQKESLAKAFSNKTPITLRLKYEDIAKGDGKLLHLTASQIKKIKQAVSEKRGVDLKMSKTQIKNSLKIVKAAVLGKGLQVKSKGGNGMRVMPAHVMQRPPPFIGTWGEKK